MTKALLALLLAAAPAFAQAPVVVCGPQVFPAGGPGSAPVFLRIDSDNDQWEAAQPPGAWHTVTIPDLPDGAVAVELSATLAISPALFKELVSELQVFFRPVGGPEPLRWQWQIGSSSWIVPGLAGAADREIYEVARTPVSIRLPVNAAKQVQFKWRKLLNYVDQPANANNWPTWPSFGCGVFWTSAWLAP